MSKAERNPRGHEARDTTADATARKQPTEQERARSARITEQKEDELQPLKEKSGF